MKQPEVKPYKTTIMKPTNITKPTLLLAAALVCLLAAGCERDDCKYAIHEKQIIGTLDAIPSVYNAGLADDTLYAIHTQEEFDRVFSGSFKPQLSVDFNRQTFFIACGGVENYTEGSVDVRCECNNERPEITITINNGYSLLEKWWWYAMFTIDQIVEDKDIMFNLNKYPISGHVCRQPR